MTRTWFVTGAGRGIGAEIVRAALDAGDRVVATARDPKKISLTSERLVAVELDITSESQANNAVAAAGQRFGRIDVLVNNAGYGHLGIFEETSPQAIRAQYDTNVFGTMNVTRAAWRALSASTDHT